MSNFEQSVKKLLTFLSGHNKKTAGSFTLPTVFYVNNESKSMLA